MGSWGQDAWVSPFSYCCPVPSCPLSFSFLIKIRAGEGEEGRPLEGAAPGLEAVIQALPAVDCPVHSKLLINCWFF